MYMHVRQVHTTTEGFATYGGMGQDVARALVSMSLPTKPWLSCKWMGLRSPSPAAILFVTGVVWLYRRYVFRVPALLKN